VLIFFAVVEELAMSRLGGASGAQTVLSFGRNGKNLLCLSSPSGKKKRVSRPSRVNLSFLPEGTFVVSSPKRGMFVSSTGVVYSKEKRKARRRGALRLFIGRKEDDLRVESVSSSSSSSNGSTTLFLLQDRKRVFAMGDNTYGQVLPAHPSRKKASLQEIDLGLSHGTTVLEIAAGGYHCGAALSNGQLAMWGRACYLGTGSEEFKPHLKIAFLSLPRGRAVSLAMGFQHTVVVFKGLAQQEDVGGSIASFGDGYSGLCGFRVGSVSLNIEQVNLGWETRDLVIHPLRSNLQRLFVDLSRQ